MEFAARLVAVIEHTQFDKVVIDGIPCVKVTIDDGLPPAKTDYAWSRISEELDKGKHELKVVRKSNTNVIITTT